MVLSDRIQELQYVEKQVTMEVVANEKGLKVNGMGSLTLWPILSIGYTLGKSKIPHSYF
jgi:hypothetical protein